MNACELRPPSHVKSTCSNLTVAQMDRAEVRIIKRAMVTVLQVRPTVTGCALLADLAYLHLCEGGASGPIWHEGGADNLDFYRLSCVALDELERDGFVVRRTEGDHEFIALARRRVMVHPVVPAADVQMTMPAAQSREPLGLRGASAVVRVFMARPLFLLASPARFRVSVSNAVAAGVGMTAVGVAMTGCMAPVAYDQPRYSYFLPSQRHAAISSTSTGGQDGDVGVPSRLQALPRSETADASIPARGAMPVTAHDHSTLASALALEIASALKEGKPASVPPSPLPAASVATGGDLLPMRSSELKTDMRFESVKRIVSFDYASSQLNPAARQQLQSIVPMALQATSVKVTGATDASGDSTANKRLALSRAVAVARSLIASGVATSHVRAMYCTSCFVGSNSSDEGRRSNRRVDVEMVMPENFKGMATSTPRTAELER